MSVLKHLTRGCLNKKVKVLARPTLNGDCKYSSVSGILNSGLPDVEIPNGSLDEYVFENIGKWENHTAVVSFFSKKIKLKFCRHSISFQI